MRVRVTYTDGTTDEVIDVVPRLVADGRVLQLWPVNGADVLHIPLANLRHWEENISD